MSQQKEADPIVPGRECGSCSMCCKLPGIPFLDPPKPAGQWCRHCQPGRGCGIWSARPEGCIRFNCDWRKNARLGDEWRPDRCGFLLTRTSETSPYEVLVEPNRSDAWRKEPYYSGLRRVAALVAEYGLPVIVVAGSRHWILLPDREVAVPQDHISSGLRIYRQTGVPGEPWQVEFTPVS